MEENGANVDPTTTVLPMRLSNTFLLTVFDDVAGTSDTIIFLTGNDQAGTTTLGLTIDDVVSVNGDDAVINYRWRVSRGLPYVSALYSTMYMEHIDSNLELTYYPYVGDSGIVLAPNTKVTIEGKSNASVGLGKIRLKLNNNSGFGPRSSKLRVTVEWQ